MTDQISFAGTIGVEGRRIRGSVLLKGQRTFRNNEWVEVDPAALVAADASDTVANVDHNRRKMLGRVKNKTLSLKRTEDGIEYATADLPNTTAANDALEEAKGEYFGGSSFTIEGLRSKFSTDPDGTRVRTITHIGRLVDVSPVYDPAFVNSSAQAFSKEIGMSDPQLEPQPEPPKAPEPQPLPKPDGWAEFAANLTTPDLESQVDSLMASEGFKNNVELIDRVEGFNKELGRRKVEESKTKMRAETAVAINNARKGIVSKAPAQSEMFASDDYGEAFGQYLRSGDARSMEQFAQTITGDGSQGGFMVPDGFVNKITERLKAFGGIASLAEEITTSTGESLRWPYIDDTANKAQIVAEDTQATTGADLVFDNIELGAFEYDATGASGNPIEVSLPLLQDSAFDIEALLERLLGKRIGRKQADHWATGAGGTEPVGLFTKAADTMTATVSSLAAVEQIFQVDSDYRDGGQCYWVMSDTSLAKVWGAQATTNEPLFQPNRTINGKPFDTLLGYPIKIDPAAGNLVAFGDIQAGYIIRRVRGVQLLVDPYVPMVRRAVRYHAWARADGNIQDPNAYSVSSWAGVSADT